MDRRTYVRNIVGTAGIVAVAGCVGDDDDTEGRPTDENGQDTDEDVDTAAIIENMGDDSEEPTDETEEPFDGTTGPSQAWPQPGDEAQWSRRLSVGLHGTYRIEDGERHYFNVELTEGDLLTTTMYFNHEDGDLNLEILNPDENVVGSSTSDSDDESVTIEAAESDAYRGREVYYVVPYGSPGVTNQYDIEIELD